MIFGKFFPAGVLAIIPMFALYEIADSFDYHHTLAQGFGDLRVCYVSIVDLEFETGELPSNWLLG